MDGYFEQTWSYGVKRSAYVNITIYGKRVTQRISYLGLLQDTLEVLTNVLKFRSQQVLRDRYNLKDIPVVTTRVIEGVIVTSNQRTGVKFGSFFSKLFGTPMTSEIDGQIYSTFVGYLKGGEIQGIKLKLVRFSGPHPTEKN